MVPQTYTPLPFGTYYHQTQKPMYYQTIQKPMYYQSLSQEYKHYSNHVDNPQANAYGDKSCIPYFMWLPVCPCWCCMCMQLYCHSILPSDPDGEETVTFPEETGPLKFSIPSIPGMPVPMGGILGHHGLPFEAQHITR